MGVYGGPDIVEDGLILCVDAGSNRSYPGATGTTWIDISGSGKNGSLVNMNSSNYSATNGGILTFDGTNETVNFGTGNTFFPMYAFTMDMWFRCDGTTPTTGTDPGLFGWTYGLSLRVRSTSLMAYIDNGTSATYLYSPSTYSFFDSSWHNVSVQANSTTMWLYIDGKSAGSVETTWSGTTRWATNTANIGRDNNNINYYFRGAISNFKIYNRVLTADEVAQNFAATRGRFGI